MRTRTAATAATLLTLALTACGGTDEPGDHMAAIMCEDFVKQKLTSPGTAEFPGVTSADYAKTTTISSKSPWKYKVTGVVDSQNALGATVRSDYVCTVSTKDNDTWTLGGLNLTPH
jgi:hypothetical protein